MAGSCVRGRRISAPAAESCHAGRYHQPLANTISSGVEPVFSMRRASRVLDMAGRTVRDVEDYAQRECRATAVG